MRINNKKSRNIFIILIIVVIILLFCLWQNNSIVITHIIYENSKIPDKFNGYKIVQISDLHNKEFGENQKYLLSKIKMLSPDIIIITGDLIDRRFMNIDVAIEFVSGAVSIAPVYYVSGNHEAWSNKYDEIKQKLLDLGVNILDDSSFYITRDGEFMSILGLSDPDFLTSSYSEGTDTSKINENIKILSNNESFKILLSHRPELFDIYVENNIDLVFSGHAHGGQIRFPFVGAIIAPDQGWFPEYTSGEYSKEDTTMIVSRGLGNSVFPFRIFNRPEIIEVTLTN